MTTTRTILCVDGDERRRADTVGTLADVDVDAEVVEADTVAAVEDAMASTPVDCIVTEYDLPDGTGVEAAASVRAVVPDAGCVLYTAADHESVETTGADDVVVEFVDREATDAAAELRTLVGELLRRRTHTAYPVPDDEPSRLDAVERYEPVLDGACEAMDRLVAIARGHFDTSAAFVSLIGEREQVYFARDGFEFARLPRQETVCTYAMLEDGVTAIEDIRTDPVFSANETLREAGIHAYAGAVLRTRGGDVVGTFCVLDDEPRSFSASERALLQHLADEAMSQLELRRRLVDARSRGDTR